MGKYSTFNQFQKKDNYHNSNKHIFNVNVNIHGKRHIEKYSIPVEHLELAIELDLFKINSNGYVDYLDWKPLHGDKNVSGLHIVNDYYHDNKYIYAVTDTHVFSLPKYLEKKIVNKNIIIYGKREY